MEILNVVRFDGLKNRDWIIFKHYSEKIILGSQLIVQEGQVAIFVKGGEVTDVFSSGTYTLSTQNLPILSSLINLPFRSKTPFSAEIYFVNKAVKMELYWGTTDPIQLIDPKFFVKLNVRAFGQMGIRIVDPVVFFKKLIGGMQTACLVQLEKIKDFFKGVIIVKVKSAIADAVITKKCSALEISIKLEELSQTVSKHVSKSMEDYGISLVNFYIQSVNFPSEDFGAINKILERVENPVFVVFSDDPDWCKSYLKQFKVNYRIVDWNKGQDSYQDMFLMSQCKHNIIANSTFSWWGAWLNQNENKVVVAPSEWTKKHSMNYTLSNWSFIKSK